MLHWGMNRTNLISCRSAKPDEKTATETIAEPMVASEAGRLLPTRSLQSRFGNRKSTIGNVRSSHAEAGRCRSSQAIPPAARASVALARHETGSASLPRRRAGEDGHNPPNLAFAPITAISSSPSEDRCRHWHFMVRARSLPRTGRPPTNVQKQHQ